MAAVPAELRRTGFAATERRDAWWLAPLVQGLVLAVLESDATRLTETITEWLGVASRHELSDLRRRVAALDRRLETLARENEVSQATRPLTSEFN